MRVCLFTDTLADVNGVSRFIRAAAEGCDSCGLDLHVITSTSKPLPTRDNIHNIRPVFSRPMPGYATLDLAIPDGRALRTLAAKLAPTIVHASTPGPVGSMGRAWSRRHGLPLVATYHTDFPSYIDHLFDDRVLTWACAASMRWFYRPCARVLTRSRAYAEVVQGLGVAPDRVEVLAAGTDTIAFSPAHRDPTGAVWGAVPGVRAESLKVLYVGRVSVEKNLPLLARIWPSARAGLRAKGIDAQLVVVGDGPYRAEMTRDLAGTDTCFAGFRHGAELSAIYASSDLFVFPSRTDTLGQSVMEAQASGLPAIVSDEGGPSSVVQDGITGRVLPAASLADAHRWASTIESLLADTSTRHRFSAAGAARIAAMPIGLSLEQFRDAHHRALETHNARAHPCAGR